MREYLKTHPGKTIGVAAGFFFGVIYLFFGLLKTIVVFLMIILGYYIGSKFDKKENIGDVIKQIMPEHFFDRNHH